jgi:hypothetical protein
MRSYLHFGALSLVMLAAAFTLSGCYVEKERVVHEPTPTEGYYDHEHHRWYHDNAWVMCDDRDPHCPPG